MPRVAVTGASGFLGAAAVRTLQERGHEVVGLTRVAGALPASVTEVVGDLDDAEALARLVAGADAVVHAAGLVRSTDRLALDRVNVQGTMAVVRAAAAVPRVVHVSTAGIHGRPGTTVDETSPPAPTNPYERAKAAAEVAVRSARGDAVVLRPTNVVGVGHPEDPLVRFFAAVVAGRVVTIPQARTSYVSVRDVASAVADAVEHPDPAPVRILNQGRSVAALAASAADLLGVPDQARVLPAGVGRVLVPLAGSVRRWLPAWGRVASAFDTTSIESRVAVEHPPAGLDDALRAMIAHYRVRGLL